MINRPLALGLISLALAVPARADQEGRTRLSEMRLSLRECVDLVLARNLDIEDVLPSGLGYTAGEAAGTPTALREATGDDPDTLTADMVAAAANSGDALARAFWSDAERYLTLAIANYVTLVNPETLILGGGVFDGVPELFDDLTGAVLAATTILARESLRIEHARLGEWAGVLGAAALSLQPAV